MILYKKKAGCTISLWLINNFLVLFSGQPPFVVVVSHQVIVESCQSLYRYLWEISLPKN